VLTAVVGVTCLMKCTRRKVEVVAPQRVSRVNDLSKTVRDKTEAEEARGITVRARVRRGGLDVFDSIDIAEGKEVSVTIREVSPKPDLEAFRRAAGKWKGTLDAEKLIRAIYRDRLAMRRKLPRL
jgi:hypothetical protein